MEPKNDKMQRRVGLCLNCEFMRRIESDRGATFYMCQRAFADAAFPKYPRLPVLTCAGYKRSDSPESEAK